MGLECNILALASTRPKRVGISTWCMILLTCLIYLLELNNNTKPPRQFQRSNHFGNLRKTHWAHKTNIFVPYIISNLSKFSPSIHTMTTQFQHPTRIKCPSHNHPLSLLPPSPPSTIASPPAATTTLWWPTWMEPYSVVVARFPILP